MPDPQSPGSGSARSVPLSEKPEELGQLDIPQVQTEEHHGLTLDPYFAVSVHFSGSHVEAAFRDHPPLTRALYGKGSPVDHDPEKHHSPPRERSFGERLSSEGGVHLDFRQSGEGTESDLRGEEIRRQSPFPGIRKSVQLNRPLQDSPRRRTSEKPAPLFGGNQSQPYAGESHGRENHEQIPSARLRADPQLSGGGDLYPPHGAGQILPRDSLPTELDRPHQIRQSDPRSLDPYSQVPSQ